MSGIWGDLFIVLGVFMVSLSLINLGFRAGAKKVIREAIIDDARHRDHAIEQMGSQIVRKVLDDGHAAMARPCPDDSGALMIGDLDANQKAALEISALAESGIEEIRLIHDASCDAWVATALSRHPMGDGTGTGVDR